MPQASEELQNLASNFDEVAQEADKSLKSVSEFGLGLDVLKTAIKAVKTASGVQHYKAYTKAVFDVRKALGATQKEFIAFRDNLIRTGKATTLTTQKISELFTTLKGSSGILALSNKEFSNLALQLERAFPAAAAEAAQALKSMENRFPHIFKWTQQQTVAQEKLMGIYQEFGPEALKAFNLVRTATERSVSDAEFFTRAWEEAGVGFSRIMEQIGKGPAKILAGFSKLVGLGGKAAGDIGSGLLEGVGTGALLGAGLFGLNKLKKSRTKADVNRLDGRAMAISATGTPVKVMNWPPSLGGAGAAKKYGGNINAIDPTMGPSAAAAGPMGWRQKIQRPGVGFLGSRAISRGLVKGGGWMSSAAMPFLAGPMGSRRRRAGSWMGKRARAGAGQIGLGGLMLAGQAVGDYQQSAATGQGPGAGGILSGALSGGVAGAAFGPVGIAAGALIGAGTSIASSIMGASDYLEERTSKIADLKKLSTTRPGEKAAIEKTSTQEVLQTSKKLEGDILEQQKKKRAWALQNNRLIDMANKKRSQGEELTENQVKAQERAQENYNKAVEEEIRLRGLNVKNLQMHLRMLKDIESASHATADLAMVGANTGEEMVEILGKQINSSRTALKGQEQVALQFMKSADGLKHITDDNELLRILYADQSDLTKEQANAMASLVKTNDEFNSSRNDALGTTKKIVNLERQRATAGAEFNQAMLGLQGQIIDSQYNIAQALKQPLVAIEAYRKGFQPILDARAQEEQKLKNLLQISKDVNLTGAKRAANAKDILESKAKIIKYDEQIAQRADYIRRSWEEVFTQRSMNMPTGSYILPTSTGLMERGPTFYPYAQRPQFSGGTRAGFGTYGNMMNRARDLAGVMDALRGSIDRLTQSNNQKAGSSGGIWNRPS